EWFGEERLVSRAMIDIGTVGWFDLAWIIAAFTLAMWLIASAFAGYDRARLSAPERILRGALGFLALLPQLAIAMPAALAGLAVIVAGLVLSRRAQAVPN
ncbi:MAG: hypothetical protein ACU0CN_04080, partial [Pseudooceanicola nanhaiensis]